MVWNSEWEYNNQDTLKDWYQKKIPARNRIWQSERLSVKAAAESFTRRSRPRNTASILGAVIVGIKRN